ncbi:MAG: SDR family oxidoreductase [Bacillota bacterium]
MQQRILITGASGNIGREIVSRLKERQIDFIAASRDESYFSPEIRQRLFDYSQSPLLEYLWKEADVLFLLIPLSPSMKEYARRAIQAAQKSKIQFILFNSMLGANPDSSYLLQQVHGEIESLLDMSGIPWAAIRGNRFMQGFVRRHLEDLRQGAVFLPERDAKSSFVDTRDVADVAVDILLNPMKHIGKIYNLTGPEALTIEEMVAEVSKIVGHRIAYVPVTEAAARHRMLREGGDLWTTEAILSQYRAAREGATAAISPHYRDLRGVEPRRFADLVWEMADFIREGSVESFRSPEI